MANYTMQCKRCGFDCESNYCDACEKILNRFLVTRHSKNTLLGFPIVYKDIMPNGNPILRSFPPDANSK